MKLQIRKTIYAVIARAVLVLLVTSLGVGCAHTPFHIESRGTAPAGNTLGQYVALQVPPGKHLVIEYASARGPFRTGGAAATQEVTFQVRTSNDNAYVSHEIGPLSPSPSGSLHEQTIGRLVRLYADPGTNVFCLFIRKETSLAEDFKCKLSGYLTNTL